MGGRQSRRFTHCPAALLFQLYRYRTNSGSLAIFVAIRRASFSSKVGGRQRYSRRLSVRNVTPVTARNCELSYTVHSRRKEEATSNAEGELPMRKVILFVAGVVTGILISVGTWSILGTMAPTTALAGSTIDPFAMMTGAKGLPTSHYDDYSLVFID
jgi:hypothetical protein